MRLLLIFDLPQVEIENKKDYRLFRSFLLKTGFIMMQESVYSKLLLNTQSIDSLLNKIKKNLPKVGKIMILTLTEKQYNSIEFILGKNVSNVINHLDKVVFL